MGDEHGCTFSVVTPTFNREAELPRLYASLRAQTFTDFEWVLADDGSTDGTQGLVEQWTREAPFPIRYSWEPNRGRHLAHNRGVEQASGRFCALSDSDDWYAPTALERFLHHWESIPDDLKPLYANVGGLFAHENGDVVGTPFPSEVFDSTQFEFRFVWGVVGDKSNMFRTDVLRRFPFPHYEERAWVPPSLVWNRIATHYKSRFVNEVVAYKEYLPGGYTHKGIGGRVKDSSARRVYYQELLAMERRITPDVKLRYTGNYARHSFHQGIGLRRQRDEAPSRRMWLATLPLGVALYLRDRRALRKAAAARGT